MKLLHILTAMAVTSMCACQLEGNSFIQDRRVQIESPDYREIVELPLAVEWEVSDDALATELGDTTQFGVYVDIDPQPPGEPLDYFGRDDPACMRQSDCPDEQYLRQLGVRTTTDTEVVFDTLPIAPGVDLENGDPDFHEVTLVLLDEQGVRRGESAWAIIFEVDREA